MRRTLPLSAALTASLLLVFLSPAAAHNITRILNKYPQFSTFNQYLSKTHLASEINRRQTISVLALDNAAMSSILDKGFALPVIKNVLSLHVLVDYYSPEKLHGITNGTTTTATLFQSSGLASGDGGYVNITDLKGGKVAFGAVSNDAKLDAYYVKSIDTIPYNISVLQISQPLISAAAEAPAPAPAEFNLTAVLRKKNCKTFADLLVATGAEATFQMNIDGGLTVFCPSDDAFKSFMPKYKNLTAPHKSSLLLYHGVPVYQSIQMLKSNNGEMNTLATDGSNYAFTVQNDDQEVTLKTKVDKATIQSTLIDQDPLAVYTIDKVLMPKELFKAEALAPAPAPTAESPKAHKAKKAKDVADAPASDAPESDPADQSADNSGAIGMEGVRGLGVALMGLGLGLGAMFM